MEGFDAGTVFAKLQLHKGDWDSAIKSLFNDLKQVGSATEGANVIMANFGKIGVAAVVAVTAALTTAAIKTADYADKVFDMSQRTGIAAEILTGLKLAAETTGTSMDGLAKGLKFLARNAYDAGQGADGAEKKFKTLGIEVKDAEGKLRPVESLLLDVADRFDGMKDGTEKTALALKLFGRAGSDLIPFLNEGRSGLEKLKARAEELGITFDQHLAKAGDKLKDSLTESKNAGLGLTMAIGERFMPVVQMAVEAVTKMVVWMKDFIRSNPDLIDGFSELAKGVIRFVEAVLAAVGWIIQLSKALADLGGAQAYLRKLQAKYAEEWEAENERGHKKWLEGHNQRELLKKKDVEDTATITDAGAKLWHDFYDKLKKATLSDYEYKKWSLEHQYLDQVAALSKEKATMEQMLAVDRWYNIEKGKIIKEQSDKDRVALDFFATYTGTKVASTLYKVRNAYRDAQESWAKTLVQAREKAVEEWNSIEMRMKMALTAAGSYWASWGEKAKDVQKKVKTNFTDVIQVMQNSANAFFTALSGLSTANTEVEKKNLDDWYAKRKETINKSTASEEEKNAKLAALDAEYEGKKKALQKDANERQKGQAIAQAIINTALAVAAALSTKPFIPMGLIAAAIATAAGLAQVAVIRKTPIPMAQGGLIQEPSHVYAGESGPEAFIPLPKLERMLGTDRGGGRGGNNITFNVRAIDAKGVRDFIYQEAIPILQQALSQERLLVPPKAVRNV